MKGGGGRQTQKKQKLDRGKKISGKNQPSNQRDRRNFLKVREKNQRRGVKEPDTSKKRGKKKVSS